MFFTRGSGLQAENHSGDTERNWCCTGNWVSQSLWSKKTSQPQFPLTTYFCFISESANPSSLFPCSAASAHSRCQESGSQWTSVPGLPGHNTQSWTRCWINGSKSVPFWCELTFTHSSLQTNGDDHR